MTNTSAEITEFDLDAHAPTYASDAVKALVRTLPDGRAELRWTDYVCGEWAETFSGVAVAYARLAVLIECESRDWQYGFATTADEFDATFRTEIERHLTS